MRRENEKVLAGGIGYTARSICMPGGVPGFMMFVEAPVYFIQSPRQVVMIYVGDEQVRHVYLDMPHSENPTPSWYGESVGHYEGDTLVIDTIGLNDRTTIDNFRTPHTKQLHVTEHWKLADAGGVRLPGGRRAHWNDRGLSRAQEYSRMPMRSARLRTWAVLCPIEAARMVGVNMPMP
jgi:hypothetical protein